MKIKFNKYIKALCFTFLGLLSFCSLKSEAHAASYGAIFRSYRTNGETRWYNTSSSKDGKHVMTDVAAGYFTMDDGKTAYCIEPGVESASYSSGIKYTREKLTTSNLSKAGIADVETFRKLQRISFYGYGYNGDTSQATYVATQMLIWQIQGKATLKAGASSTDLVTSKMTTIQNRITNATKVPSFDEESAKSPVGESITFTDTEKVLGNFKVKSCKGCNATIEGNNLVVSSDDIGKATVTLERAITDTNEYANENYLYTVGAYQKLAVLGDPLPVQSIVTVEFEGSTVKPVKRDSETGGKNQGDSTFEGGIYWLMNEKGDLIEELVTDKNGVMTSNIKLGYGTYTIKEVKAPKGYMLSTEEYTFTIDDSNIGKDIPIELFDTVIKGNVVVEKRYGALDEGFHIEKDAEFDIINSKGEIVGHIKSDENGISLINLPYGTYTLKQTKGKEGYAFIDDVQFSITENDKIVTIRAVNLKLGRLNITKTDIGGKDVIEGATIQIYKVNESGKDELIYEGITDKTGQINVSNLLKGKYYFIETKAPKHFILNTDKHFFEVTEYGKIITETFINEKYSTFTITKFELGGKDVVEGATIEIYKVKDDGTEELIYTGITDADGKIYLDEIEKGTYFFIERNAPAGYVLNRDKHFFVIDENGKDYEETFENSITTVTIEKRSAEDNSLLEGAEFCIYNEDGTLYACGTTDKSGTVKFERLPYGKYYFIETKAPKGYEKSEEKIFFEVDEENNTILLSMDNNIIIEVPNTDKTEVKKLIIGGVLLILIGAGVIIYAAKKRKK